MSSFHLLARSGLSPHGAPGLDLPPHRLRLFQSAPVLQGHELVDRCGKNGEGLLPPGLDPAPGRFTTSLLLTTFGAAPLPRSLARSWGVASPLVEEIFRRCLCPILVGSVKVDLFPPGAG